MNIWFNHWFSTSYWLIRMMKEFKKELENEEIYVIGTGRQEDSVVKKACDAWYPEPLGEGEEYVKSCLEFCLEHEIDVFVPRHHMVDVSRNKDKFEDMGVKVLVEDYEKMQRLNDKAATYDFFKDTPGLYIPDYEIVNTADQFVDAYGKLKEKYDQLCVKFVQDEGAMSYRRLVDCVDRFESLKTYRGARMDYDTYLAGLRGVTEFDDLMVMPYLPGTEISVDCLNTAKGLIAIPRFKGNARAEKIIFDHDILQMTEKIMELTRLKCPCNVQFKMKDDKPYLLEINTRMSGGLQMSCLAEKINIPAIALGELIGKPVDWKLEKVEKTVSFIEMPEVME